MAGFGQAPEPPDTETAFRMDAMAPTMPRQRRIPSPPSSTKILHNATEALFFAYSILCRDPRDPLLDVPPALVLGFDIAARQPPLSKGEWGMLWRMLRRMVHLEALTLEDGDGLVMEIQQEVLEGPPLSLPRLKYLKYCMSYSVDGCHAFLSSLRDASLDKVVLHYPDGDDRDEDEQTPDPVALLARASTAATLGTLQFENLRYSYFNLPVPVAQFPFVGRLSLGFDLGKEDPQLPILGYLLAAFPAVKVFEIETSRPLPIAAQQPTVQDIRTANIGARAHATAGWSLERVTGSVLDLWLLGFEYSSATVHISRVNAETVESVGNLMYDLFSGTTPSTLYVTFSERGSCKRKAMILFFRTLLAYWQSSPFGTIPKEFVVKLRMNDEPEPEEPKLEDILTRVFSLLRDGNRLEHIHLSIYLKCKDTHYPPPPRPPSTLTTHGMDVDDADDSGESSDESDTEGDGLERCQEARALFDAMPKFLDQNADALRAASSNGTKYLVRATSFCSPKHGFVVSSGGAREERVRNWLPMSE
ncbi:hypothetical protein BV20DRAFT_966042 [Pilatotrama ljubarskyi]|nr:hypothetical protein BV20DRAFT_966042 [Pilatotrama ljubarskyi]